MKDFFTRISKQVLLFDICGFKNRKLSPKLSPFGWDTLYNVVCVLLSKNEPQKTHRKLLITAWNCTKIWRKTRTYVHQKKYCIQRKILNLCTMLQYKYCSCFKNKLRIQKRGMWKWDFFFNWIQNLKKRKIVLVHFYRDIMIINYDPLMM